MMVKIIVLQRWRHASDAGMEEALLDRLSGVLVLATRRVRALRGGRRRYATASPAARRAARSVFTSSIAIVIGPTPPGTGEIADAFSATAS